MATTSLFEFDSLSTVGDVSILTDSNNNDMCILKTKKVIVTEFKNITWDVAKLEGENISLEEAIEIIKTFLTTPFSSEERHHRRVNKIIAYEESH